MLVCALSQFFSSTFVNFHFFLLLARVHVSRHYFSFSRYCVCYIHEEFNRLLHVLKKDSLVAHENCDCACAFCAGGSCNQVFDSDMDLYWCMRHMLCAPSQLQTHSTRNVFPPRCDHISFAFSQSLSRYNSIISLRVFSCLEGRCSAAEPCLYI